VKNAFEFKNSITVGKFKKATAGSFGDYVVEINGENYIIDQPKRGYWGAWDNLQNEYYAINKTRKDVVADIISGLYYQYKHGL